MRKKTLQVHPVGQRLLLDFVPLLWAGCQAVPETGRLIPLYRYIYLHVYLVYYSWGGLQMGMSRPLDCQPAIQFHWRSKSCLRRFPTSLWGQPIASWSMFVDPVPRDCTISLEMAFYTEWHNMCIIALYLYIHFHQEKIVLQLDFQQWYTIYTVVFFLHACCLNFVRSSLQSFELVLVLCPQLLVVSYSIQIGWLTKVSVSVVGLNHQLTIFTKPSFRKKKM